MNQFILRDGLKIGHPRIDNQHERLLDALRALRRQVESASPATDCAARLRAFIQLMEEHFADEERLLNDFRYGATRLKAHVQHHRKVMETVRALAADCAASGRYTAALVEELLSLLMDDLIAADMAFKTHLQKTGFRPE